MQWGKILESTFYLSKKKFWQKLHSNVHIPLEEAYDVWSINLISFLLLIQNEIKTVKRENEPKLTLSEEIYSTLDDLLGGEYVFVCNIQRN